MSEFTVDDVSNDLLDLLTKFSENNGVKINEVSTQFKKIVKENLSPDVLAEFNLTTYILENSSTINSEWGGNYTVNSDFNFKRLKSNTHVLFYNIVLRELVIKEQLSEIPKLATVPEKYRVETTQLYMSDIQQLALMLYYIKLRSANKYDSRLYNISNIFKYVKNPLLVNLLYIMIFEGAFGCHGKFFDPCVFYQRALRDGYITKPQDNEVIATLALWFANPIKEFIADVYSSIDDKRNAAFIYSRSDEPDVRVYLAMKFGNDLQKEVIQYEYSSTMWKDLARIESAQG